MKNKTLFNRLGSAAACVVASVGLWTWPAIAVDLSVGNIEITQAIQTPANAIQLIAQRGTAVRVTITVADSGVAVAGVSGRLHVFVGGLEITPVAGLLPINAPMTAPLAPVRANQNDTLNFELLAPSGIGVSADVDFQVTIDPAAGEVNVANNSGAVNNLSFVERKTPKLFFTRINYIPSGLGLPSLADVAPGVGDMMVRGLLPVNDADPMLYQQGLFPTLTFGEDANGDGFLDANCLDDGVCADGSNLMDLLASCRQLIVDNGLGANDCVFLYGWLAGNPIQGNGLGQVDGHNAFGNTQVTRYQRTYAHELTHNFGFDHIANNIDQVGWDVGGRLQNNPAGNNIPLATGRVKPTTLFDIQVAGIFTAQAWIWTPKYNDLLDHAWLAPDGGGGGLAVPQTNSPRVLVLQGSFNAQGTQLLRLQPAFRFPWPSQPPRRTGQEVFRFAARVTDTQGTTLVVPFNALLGDDAGGTNDAYGFFEVMVPVSPALEASLVRITPVSNTNEFGRLTRSQTPPQLQILAPVQGQQLGAQTSVRFSVIDPDTPPVNRQYQIAYSPDNGSSWVPIGVDIPGTATNIVFDSTAIPFSQGGGVLRIFASDGLNTSFVDVRGLSVVQGVPRVLFLNEWLANTDPPQTDFIEVFNAGPTPFDVSGYSLTDDLNLPAKFRIPVGTVIAAGGFLAFGEAQLGFALSAAGENIGLFTPAGVLVDSANFGPQQNGISQGLWPNGGQNRYSMTPTPGAPNLPLIITTQPQDQTVPAGGTATFSVAALGLTPFNYQWFRNGAIIPGATSPGLSIPNVQPADNGSQFSVRVGNAAGSLSSRQATLTVQTPVVAEVFSPTGNLTPPNAVYASPLLAVPVTFPNGIVIRTISHGRLRFHPPPPVLNGIQTYASAADVRFELSLNGGATFNPVTAPADVTVRMLNTADDGTTRAFSTEMLSLNITGGGLPAGVRVRESPTLVSPGQATSRLVPTGGAMVSSVFDVRLEVSLNNGATWMPGATPARVVLGIESPEVFSVTANPTTPNAVYASPNPLLVSTNQNGTRIRAVSHGRLRLHPPPPPLGSNILYTSDGEVRLQLSLPGSSAFNNIVAPASVTVNMRQVKDDGTSMFFDTEMASLEIVGGTLPGNIRLRESPTRQSLGRATARFVRGGGAQVSSYFEVELEGSVNNGATYQPFITPVRVELALEAPENLSPSANPTPPNFSFNTPLNPPVVSNSLGFIIRRVRHNRLVLHPPPPPIGGFINYTSPSTATIEYSRDGGLTFSNATATGNVAVRMTGAKNDGSSLFFDTEMLSLDLSGGSLPAGIRLRESPTRASLGRSTARFVENGAALVSSFFEVQIDVSANNGTSYVSNNAPIRVELVAEAPEDPSPSDNLTPVNSAYISQVNAPSINFGAGIFTRDYLHFRLGLHPVNPVLGGSLVYTSTSLARFEVSLDGERTYQPVTANALTSVRMTHTTDIGPTRYFDTEMLQLDFFGGTLPNNVRIRLTPNRPQRGQASIRLLNPDPAPPGLGPQPVWGLSSFFDLTTDISTDGGASWRTATASQRVVLDSRSPQNFSPTDNLTPPNAAYVSLANTPPIAYTNGILTRRYRHFRLVRHPPIPIDPIGPIIWTSPGFAEFQVTLNGGVTWMDVRAQADTTVRMTPIGTTEPDPTPWANSTIQHFETELLRLDIFGGNLPPGVRLRLNPNMASRGAATVQRTGGGFNLSSFLDINTQLSLNNGQTWHSSKSDSRVVLDTGGPENFSMTGNLTPLNGAYVSAPAAPAIRYLNNIQTRDYVHFRLQLHPPLPLLGSSLVYTSTGIADFCVSMNGGASFIPVRGTAQTTVRMTHSANQAGPDPTPWLTQIFETEMLQLDISGGSLPAGTRIRVSPTRPSRGQATVEQVDGGSRVSSFFDLWTDLSTDGGQTWSPAINLQRVSLDSRAPESKVPAPNLTPANSAYVSQPNAPAILYPGNIITRNYIHGRLLPHPIPPLLGSSLVYTSAGQAVFQVSLDGGRTFRDANAQALTTVRMVAVPGDPDPQPNVPISFFENEMVRLDIFGGDLPQGVRLRISPDPMRPSRGQATIQRVPSPGGLAGTVTEVWDIVASFFDLWTELSTDNGQTWRPSLNAQRVVLDNRAPEGLYADPLLPPRNVSYDTAIEAPPLRYGLGQIITHRYRHRILTNIIVPPLIGTGVVYNTLGSELVFDVSTDRGLNFQTVIARADMSLRINHSEDVGGIQHYDTELLSLNFTGGQLPAGVMFRESPTRRSLGQTTIRPVQALPGQAPPPPSCENISSFIDIWTEVSINGGQTWLPADGPARVVAIAPPPKSFFPGDLLPPPGGRYVNPFRRHQDYPGGFSVRNARHRLFLNSLPPPPLGTSATHSFGSTVDMEISIDSGRTFSAVSAPADVVVQDTHTQDVGPNQYFATEIQRLDIAGGNLPASVRLRESPTRSSGGQTIICPNRGGAGGYQISSFFEVWTELSVDGGQTWVAASSPVRVELTRECDDILLAGSVWKYLDDGSDQGTAWRNVVFNDSAWASGPAELGYGDGDEMTVVNGGPVANRFITTYFRRAFNLSDVSGITGLTLRVKRDDGVIVYLNGTEVFRDNLPGGAVTAGTLALVAAPDDGATFLNAGIDPSLLVNGVNVLAAEIHQNATNSSDISFDLELLANPVLSVAPMVVVTSPVSNAVITTPGMTAPVTYAASASVADPCAGITAVQFYVNGVLVATDTTAPYTVTVDEPLGTYSVTARAFANNGNRADSASVPFRVVMIAPVVAAGSVWKYLDDGSDQGTAWTASSFDDSTWASGPAELGYGDAAEGRPEATLVNGGPVASRFITTYFRHAFNVPDASLFTELNFGVMRDDGVVVYLNGAELFRMNMPPGPINSATVALAAVAGADEATFFPANVLLSPGQLHNGLNVLAAEIHQNTNTSSDISFDLRLDGVKGGTPCGPLTITRQGNLLLIGWPGEGVLEETSDLSTTPIRWTPVPDALSPYETAVTGKVRFFRLRCPAITVSTDRTLYQPNQPVTANVQVSLAGNLTVDVFDPEAPQGAASVVFHDEGPVSPPGKSFTFGAGADGRYIVLARLTMPAAQEDALAEYGVRGPGLSGVPEEILRAQVAALDVPNIRNQLRLAAQTGQPAVLQLGQTTVSVSRLRRLQTFEPDPGAQLPPALAALETYQGEVTGNSNSVVVLNAGNDLAAGDVLIGMILINPPANAASSNELQSTTWIEPLSLYNSNAPPAAHVMYRGADVLFMPGEHVEPVSDPRDAPGPQALAALDDAFNAAAVIIDNKIVRVRVYEHFVSALRTIRRCSIIYSWAGIVTAEVRNITPRATTNRRVTVTDVRISSWQSISTSGYGGSCNSVLSKFRTDNDSVNNRLYVLFTTLGSGCGGIAYLGQGASTRWHCIVRDTDSSVYKNAVILAQEVGHNWDWHTAWDTSIPSPHDPHLCGCISERWNHRHGWWIFSWDHRHCTAMRASYDGCGTGAELRYRRFDGTGLRHLAEGIWRYH
jgi:hypothetical protein